MSDYPRVPVRFRDDEESHRKLAAAVNYLLDRRGAMKIDSITGSYTLRSADEVILADTATGAITVTLDNKKDRREIYIKNTATSGVNNVTVAPDTGDDIDRTGANLTLTPMDAAHLIYDKAESNWFVLGTK